MRFISGPGSDFSGFEDFSGSMRFDFGMGSGKFSGSGSDFSGDLSRSMRFDVSGYGSDF